MIEVPPHLRETARQLDLAWAAGVLEMVGYWHFINRGNGKVSPRISVAARQRTPEVRDELRAILGGEVTGTQRDGARRPSTRVPQWQVSGARACAEIDRLLLPHLRRRARLVRAHLTLCQRIVDYRPESFAERRLRAEEVEARDALLAQFKNIR